ncbi:hypothetical protein BH10CHL1_BH10CHL1_18420 [soil metagenome]
MNKQSTKSAHVELAIYLTFVALIVIVTLAVGNAFFPT